MTSSLVSLRMTLMPPKKQFFRSIFFDLGHGPHRLLADAGTTQLDDEDGGVVLAEQELLKICRQHLHRHRRVQHIAEPEGVQHVRHLVDLGLHGQQLVCGHPSTVIMLVDARW